MLVKSLNEVKSAPASAAATYSVRSNVIASIGAAQSAAHAPDLEIFLEGENPIGCIEGVMWVMVFNAAAFALGFAVWEACKLLG